MHDGTCLVIQVASIIINNIYIYTYIYNVYIYCIFIEEANIIKKKSVIKNYINIIKIKQ